MYVVDSADDMRIEEATKELNELLANEFLAKIPLLVFANKQDMQTAMDAEDVIEHMKLNDITDRHYNITACSAMSKEGLNEGMEWIITQLNEKNK